MATDPEFSPQIQKARRFYFDLRASSSSDLDVVCGGWERCSADYTIKREGLRFQSIEYVAQGEGIVELHGRSFKLTPGTVFSYGPEIPHLISTDPTRLLTKYFVDFSGLRASQLLQEVGLGAGVPLQVSSPNHIREVFDDLVENGMRNTVYSSAICARLLEYLGLAIRESAVPYGTFNTPAFTTYLRCRQYIEDHWLQLHTLGEVAAHCQVSEAYLCRLFQRFDHRSPYQFLTRLKMSHAIQQLETNARISDVSDLLGYPDPFHFSRVFKKAYGVSPRQFLKLGRQHTPYTISLSKNT